MGGWITEDGVKSTWVRESALWNREQLMGQKAMWGEAQKGKDNTERPFSAASAFQVMNMYRCLEAALNGAGI